MLERALNRKQQGRNLINHYRKNRIQVTRRLGISPVKHQSHNKRVNPHDEAASIGSKHQQPVCLKMMLKRMWRILYWKRSMQKRARRVEENKKVAKDGRNCQQA